MRWTGRISIVAGALALVAPLRAQLVTDQVPQERTVSVKEEIHRDLEESRFRLGPLRLSPRLSIRNLGYNDNVNGTSTDQVSDYTADIAAGFRATLPLSARVTIRAEVLPAYLWYAHEVERRALGGNLGVSVFAFLNRLTLQGTAWATRWDVQPSKETLGIARENLRAAHADIAVDFLQRLSLIGSGDAQRYSYSPGASESPPSSDVRRLDRTDWAARAGVRYRFTETVDVSAGLEGTWTDFVLEPETRNNSSRAVIAGVHVERHRFVVNLSAAYRRGEARGGSSFPPYTEPTGGGFISVTVVRPIGVEILGYRRVSYSAGDASSPYFFETRYGAGVRLRVGPRVTARGFGQQGSNRYPVFPAAPARTDDVKELVGTLHVALARSLAAEASVRRARIESTTPSETRSYTQLTVGLSLGEDVLR